MKKSLFYYCIALSLAFHLAAVLAVKLKPDNKEKTPIAIDLLGPPRLGPETRLPKPVQPKASEPGRQFARIPPSAPALPSMPAPPAVPQAKATPQPPAQEGRAMPSPPGEVNTPAPGPAPSRPAPPPGEAGPPAYAEPSCPHPGTPECRTGKPRGFVKPTQEDLMRYAAIDKEMEKTRDEEAVTLDTEDLMYTSYLQGIKRRIELIWKYPETARRDGLQGQLVMKFTIGKSGKVENIELVKSSGYNMLDEAAKQALLDANPFNPLPGNWNKETFTITGTFVYRLYGLYLR